MNWFVFIPFFAQSTTTLCVGQILCGLTWGVFATTGPAYASEVCPVALRGYLTCYVNLCWAIGQLICAGVLYGLLDVTGNWSWRIAYALQWVWPIPLIIAISFAPESPWWLVRHGKMDEAEKSLGKLDDKGSESHQKTLAMIKQTLAIEKQLESGTNYLDCFKGVNLRRTEIVCFAFAGQVLSGSTFAYTPTYFFSQAGVGTNRSYQIAVGGTAISFIGTVCSWFIIERTGRRRLYLGGIGTLTVILMMIGIIATASEAPGAKWAQVALCLIWLATYSATIGPVTFTIISETSSVALRPKSVALARNCYNFVQLISNIIEPYLINPTELNLKGKTAWFWFGTAFLTTVWAFFRLPECGGRTYDELDVMFHEKVPTRKFRTYEANIVEHSQVALAAQDAAKEKS